MTAGNPIDSHDNRDIRVAVIMGGPSAEAAVSRSSANEVAQGLAQRGYQVATIELDQNLTTALQRYAPAVVFPALHGPIGEDGTIQGFLEVLGLPYVGSDVRGSAMAMDKCVAKSVYRNAGLPVAPEVLISPDQTLTALRKSILETLGERVVIKPRAEGSAVGVMRLTRAAELDEALTIARDWQRGGLAEPYIDGSEVTVGILDLEGREPQSSPAIQIETASGEWYDFENRYAEGKSQHLIPAPRPEAICTALETIARTAHLALGLRDLSRSDFLVDSAQNITLLETNTLPGMTPTSLYPDGAKALGLSFAELMHELVRSALRRGNTLYRTEP